MQGGKSFWFSSILQKTSADRSGLSANKRFRLGNGQPLHEPAEFLLRELFQLRFVSGPLEPFLCQALVQQDISRTVPIQRLDAICPPSAEQIQRRLIHFLAKPGLHQRRQPVDLLAHVCMENAAVDTETREVSPQKELIQVADLIGCRVEFQGRQPPERKALLLLYAAIREALTNAVKHAGADKLTISVSENNGRYDVEIRNNGRAVNPPIQEGGGLSSLRKRLEQDGATMSYRYNGAVTLILTIPKE